MIFVEEAIGLVERYYDLVDRNDIPGLVSLFTTDVVYERPGYPPLHGIGELERFYRQDRVIESGKHSLRGVVANKELIAVHGDFEGRLENGKDVCVRFADFFQVAQDGLFRRRDTYFFSPQV
ncbi:nuclear transport factor 2 family protein [Streptomyces atratus]|uniref:nuclear transport factor 2 family protein n=1 Tax=Streptomyces atratus TaxID=1893 RepID=UPI0022575FC2|nr:nuclear transport factor 2 family protein [Streptomyces atratus]MCX5340141.1 nuclear transport factor 2 family protein [Streptomyces atratus]